MSYSLFRERYIRYIEPVKAAKTKNRRKAGNFNAKNKSSFNPNHAAKPIETKSCMPRPLYFKKLLGSSLSFTSTKAIAELKLQNQPLLNPEFRILINLLYD